MAPPKGTVALNNYLQKIGKLPSLAWNDNTAGPEHAPEWTCVCKIDGQAIATGTGTHKHLARDAAAEKALKVLAAD